jgi:type I restriction enzyme S subunit
LTSDQQRISEIEDKSEISSDREYEEVALSEVIDPVLGKTPKRKEDEYWEGDIKWASAKDISQNSTRKIYDTAEYMTAEGKEASNAKKMPEGTLVVIARGSLGLSAQLGEPMTFNQSCYGLEADNSKLLDDFLYYVWQYRFNQIQSVSHGTVFDTITMDSFKDIDIPLPPLETQKRICNVLTAIDDKIEINNEINETIEDMAQAMFKSWFVDFRPFDDFKTSKVGEIPEGFTISNLTDVTDIVLGGTPDSDEDSYWDGDIVWAKTKDVSNEEEAFISSTEENITKEGLEESSTEIAPEDSTIITARGTVGELAMPTFDMAINQSCYSLVAERDTDHYFVYCLMNDILNNLTSRTHGTVFDTITKRTLNEQEIVLPPAEQRKKFDQRVDPLMEKIKKNQSETEYLKELRDALLPKLMSGEIRVNDIELDELEVDSEV